MIKLLVSHTTGNENTRNIIYGLYDKKLLHSFVVSIAVYKERSEEHTSELQSR